VVKFPRPPPGRGGLFVAGAGERVLKRGIGTASAGGKDRGDTVAGRLGSRRQSPCSRHFAAGTLWQEDRRRAGECWIFSSLLDFSIVCVQDMHVF
jgi:hypothetical protein